MAQLRGEIQREKFLNDIFLEEKYSKIERIEKPIGNDVSNEHVSSNSSDESSSLNEDEILIDDDDDHPSDGFMDTWFNLLNEEDFNENNEDEESDLEEDSEDLKLLLHHHVHPADNQDAKWRLEALFKPDLEAPPCFD